MSEILQNLMAIGVLILIAFSFKGIMKGVEYLKENTENEEFKKAITILENIVSNTVVAANQTYVDKLKEEGGFDKRAQEEIFNGVKERVLDQLNADTKDLLDDTIKNVDIFINDLIEKEVRKNK
jgi:uncharacterized protein YpuA (DUF1002 family)